jgi:undecaprenyl-diphosphatase
VSVNIRKTGPTKSSFPSGHAASATAFAVTVGGLVPPLRLPLALSAAVVSYSRIHEKRHYPSDVVGGLLVGTIAAGIVIVTVGRIRRTT